MRLLSPRWRWIGLGILVLGVAAAPGASWATVITGSSSAYDGTFLLNVNGSSNSPSGPVSNVSGISTQGSYAPYDLSDPQTFPSLTQNVPVLFGTLSVSLGSASTDTTATSDVDGGAGSRTTSATSTITGPDTIVITFTPTGGSTQTLLDAVVPLDFMSSATVTGDYGSLAASTSTVISQSDPLSIWGTLFGQSSSSEGWTIGGSVYANHVYWDDGITSLVVHERTIDCSGPSGGVDTCSASVNALHFIIDDPTGSLFGTPLYTELVVGHSEALQVATAPEPAAGLLLLGSLAALVAVRRRSGPTA